MLSPPTGPDPKPDPELLPPGSAVGEYVLGELLGAGGFARVYRADHAVLSSRVAIKVITRALALDAEASQRFLNEVLAASRIDHPGVVRVLGYGKLPDGRAYQVMELIDGPSLDDHLEAHGRPPIDESLRMLEAIAAALDAAHAAGIVHRDLKPANILLAPAGPGVEPRLADFGIAKAFAADENPHLTRTGTTLGTPTYMSPEQALGRRTGPASDVYSFGVVAFELLTGRVPFEGSSPLETMMLHVQQPPPLASSAAPELGTAFDAPLAQLLAKAADDRPTTVAEAMRALRTGGDRRWASGAQGRARRLPWVVGFACLALAAGFLYVTARRPAATPASQPRLVTPIAAPVLPPPTAPPPPAPFAQPAADDGATTRTRRPTRPRAAAARDPVRPTTTTDGPAAPERPADTLEAPPDYAP